MASSHKRMESQIKRLIELEEKGSQGDLRLEKPRCVQNRMYVLCETMDPMFPDTLRSPSEQRNRGKTRRWLVRLRSTGRAPTFGRSNIELKNNKECLPSWSILVPSHKELKKAWWDRYRKICEQTRHIKAHTEEMEDDITRYNERNQLLSDRLERAIRIEESIMPLHARRMSLWVRILMFLGLRRKEPVLKRTAHVTELEQLLNEKLVDIEPFSTKLVRDSGNLNSQYKAMLENIVELEGALWS